MKDLVKEYISDLGNNPLCTTLNKGRVRLSTILDDFNKKALKNMESSSRIIESRQPNVKIEAEQRATAFKHDLKILLTKHKATIECEAEPHYGYTPNEYEIVVELECTINDDTYEIVAESATLKLGRYVHSDSL